MSQKTKFAKKKEREKKVREKLLRRRTAIRKAAKEDREKDKEERERMRAYNKANAVASRLEKELENMDDNSKSQLMKNLEILQALEAEYDREQANKTEVRGRLEEQGLTPNEALKEAMDKLQALPKKKKQRASADVVFTPNPAAADESAANEE